MPDLVNSMSVTMVLIGQLGEYAFSQQKYEFKNHDTTKNNRHRARGATCLYLVWTVHVSDPLSTFLKGEIWTKLSTF